MVLFPPRSLYGSNWSWFRADAYAPARSLFANRGQATIEFGAQFAAPGAPTDLAHLYGVIHYRDNLESFRDYDLFFSPSLAVWKFWRYEPGQQTHAQYVGGFHYDNCQDGFVTAMDRVFMPAIGLHPQYGTEGASVNTMVRTNYGCMNNHFSNPFPIDNFAGSGSGTGVQPEIVSGPTWTQASQSLFSSTIAMPWIYYDGILDPASPRFLMDFTSYDPPTRAMIQSQMANALRNVRLENQIRILPDGTIMLTHIWTDLKGRPWVEHATDGYWLAPDSAPGGRVIYFDKTQNAYVDPFANGQNSNGLYLTTGNGWVGYFIDPQRPSFGLGFYYQAHGISIFPAYNWPNAPAVLHTDYWTNLASFGQTFRQTFLVVGTKEEMQSKSQTLKNYVLVFDPASPPAPLGPLPADFDADGDVDLADFGGLRYCFNGPNRPPTDPTYCAMADLDQDGDVDLADFGVFQSCFNGPNRPPACSR